MSSFSVAQLASCCWSLAVLGRTSHPAFLGAWRRLLGAGSERVAAAGQVVLTQVWQVRVCVWGGAVRSQTHGRAP